MLQLKKDWCDVNELVYDTLSHLKEEAAKHRVIVEIKEHLPLFRVDYGLIQHTLYNLLNNAFQYTPADSAIRIRVDFDHHESGHFEDAGTQGPELIRDRMQAMSPEDFVGVLRPAFQEEEWILIGVGALLGGIAGFAQWALVFGGLM